LIKKVPSGGRASTKKKCKGRKRKGVQKGRDAKGTRTNDDKKRGTDTKKKSKLPRFPWGDEKGERESLRQVGGGGEIVGQQKLGVIGVGMLNGSAG